MSTTDHPSRHGPLATTDPAIRRFGPALIAGFVGSNVASLVKWGSEIPFPPRVAERGIPPLDMLNDLGIDAAALTYTYSGHVLNWGVAGIHHLFSIVFALVYVVLAEIFPLTTLWMGAAFAALVTIGFHYVMLPVFGWGPPAWQLPLDEHLSEWAGHILWMVCIEVFRRDIRNRITGQPDPARP